MPRILQADVEEVKSRTNIADIVGERGASFLTLRLTLPVNYETTV